MTRDLAVLLLALCAAPPLPAADAKSVLAALERAGRELRTLRADFEQTKVLTLLDESEVSRGQVRLMVPGRLRWDYVAPQPGALLVKDGRFARYVPQTKQVFRGPAKGEADLLVGFGPGAAQLGSKYEVTLLPDENIGGRAAWVLDLKPKAGQGGLFAAIRLWVDPQRHVPVQTRLTEPTGDHTTVRFEKVELNAKLPASSFDLALPKDVVEVK
jgi:outer membrane lipoprotein-sorting protein